MINTLQNFKNNELINPPDWLLESTILLVQTGSHAYGISTKDSDIDIYGVCIPPIEYLFPHTTGEILGFGRQIKRFDQFQQEGIIGPDKKTYDVSIYNIAKFFQLCLDNNPNMIDVLFVPNDCILHQTEIGKHILENNRLFLHKGCYYKFMGYAHSQWKKIKNKNPIGKRKQVVDEFGFDLKYASHLVRLALECEQILAHRDLDLRCYTDILKNIRKGLCPLREIEVWFDAKKEYLEKLYNESKLRYGPDEPEIKKLLISCIESKYGDLQQFVFPKLQ